MSIDFLPKVEVPRVDSTGMWTFYTFLKDTVYKLIDSHNENEASWRRPNLLNDWQHYGLPYQEASYRKDGNDMVYVSGVILGGTPGATSVAFLLPQGYRPAVTLRFSVSTDDAANPGHAEVDKNGKVFVLTGSATLTSLDGITFRVE